MIKSEEQLNKALDKIEQLESQQEQLKREVKQNKVLAAICISPIILTKAGVLKGKKATVWSSPLDKSWIKVLQESGQAIYQEEDVVVDGKIITANGPAAAGRFGQAIVEVLAG